MILPALQESVLIPFVTLQFQRRNRVYKEEKRKLRAAEREAKEGKQVEAAHA